MQVRKSTPRGFVVGRFIAHLNATRNELRYYELHCSLWIGKSTGFLRVSLGFVNPSRAVIVQVRRPNPYELHHCYLRIDKSTGFRVLTWICLSKPIGYCTGWETQPLRSGSRETEFSRKNSVSVCLILYTKNSCWLPQLMRQPTAISRSGKMPDLQIIL